MSAHLQNTAVSSKLSTAPLLSVHMDPSIILAGVPAKPLRPAGAIAGDRQEILRAAQGLHAWLELWLLKRGKPLRTSMSSGRPCASKLWRICSCLSGSICANGRNPAWPEQPHSQGNWQSGEAGELLESQTPRGKGWLPKGP